MGWGWEWCFAAKFLVIEGNGRVKWRCGGHFGQFGGDDGWMMMMMGITRSREGFVVDKKDKSGFEKRGGRAGPGWEEVLSGLWWWSTKKSHIIEILLSRTIIICHHLLNTLSQHISMIPTPPPPLPIPIPTLSHLEFRLSDISSIQSAQYQPTTIIITSNHLHYHHVITAIIANLMGFIHHSDGSPIICHVSFSLKLRVAW